MKSGFINTFRKFTENWYNQIEISLDRNLSGFACDAGFMGEALASHLVDAKGPDQVSGGSGFDLVKNKQEAYEVKMACLIQSKECKGCGYRKVYFTDVCSCGCKEFKIISDSRWSISAKEGIVHKHIINEYVLQVIRKGDDLSDIHYEAFVVKSLNDNFQEYMENQRDNGSNTCNLLPYSWDFYRFNPMQIADAHFKLMGDYVETVHIGYYRDNPKSPKFNLLGKTDLNKYSDASQLFLKKKNLGKDRGKTTRKL